MRIPSYPVINLLLVITLILAGCNSENSPEKDSKSNIVATFDNGHTITVNELNKYVSDYLYYKKYIDRSDAYNNALNDMLINQFKRLDFFAKGLDKNKNLIQSISRVINEELIYEYFEKEYVDKYANEEYAKKIYDIMDKEVIAQQIVLYHPEDASPVQIDSVKQEAMKIKSEIDEGKSFDSLVIRYSQDKQSLNNNGYMPPVGWMQSILDPTGNVIFHLSKNDIRVLNDNNASRIVKIIEINKIHVEPFDKIKNEIISNLKNVYSSIGTEEYYRDKKELIDENNLRWNENVLKQIVKWSNDPNFYQDKYKETLKNAIANNNETILIYSKGKNTNNTGKVDYKEYLRLLNNILILPPSINNLTEENLKKFILEAIRTDLIVKKAESLDLVKNIFNPYTNNTILKSRLVHLYNQAEVETKIPEATDEALHNFFKENENTLYYQLEKRNILVMVFPSKDQAENAFNKIEQGIPFEKVTGRYLVKTYIKERNGEIKSRRYNEKPVFGDVSFKLNESEVSNPIKFEDENNQTKYAILKCYHIRPEKQLTYEDVKNSITEDYRNYYKTKIEKEVEKKLKNKYQPVINDEVLNKLISPK